MTRPPEQPAKYWTMIISLASLILAALGILIGATKSSIDDVRHLEARMCWLETHAGKQECNDR